MKKILIVCYLLFSTTLYADTPEFNRAFCTIAAMQAIAFNVSNINFKTYFNESEKEWILNSGKKNEAITKKALEKYGRNADVSKLIQNGTYNDEEMAIFGFPNLSGPNDPEWPKLAGMGYDACLKIGQKKLASILPSSESYTKSLEEYQQAKKSHPYNKYCPQFLKSRSDCATAGNYDNCMTIRFGGFYKDVEASMICDFR